MKLKIITYNIDGLPEEIDLRELPWLLKPLAWIWYLINGTTKVTVNDNRGRSVCTEDISLRLMKSGADLIAVQEDFNYHSELMRYLYDYHQGTSMGGIDLKHIFTAVKWLPYPRLKADGLNLLSLHRLKVFDEEIIPWQHAYGYFSHANDKLTMKGFRRYTALVGVAYVDIYVLHMDADFYDPEKCPDVSKDLAARRAELEQLTEYILTRDSGNPAIVMGDTNMREDLDGTALEECFLGPINETAKLKAYECGYGDHLDRIFIIDFKDRPVFNCVKCYFDHTFNEEGRLSDHTPLVAEIELKE